MDESLDEYRIDVLEVGDIINVWKNELKTIASIRDDVANRHRYITFTDGYIRMYCFGKVIIGSKIHP